MTTRLHDRNEPLSVALVHFVAELTNRTVSSLSPLRESIDPDALERLFEPTATAPRAGTIEFRYAGRVVTVAGATDFTITVEEIDSASENGPASSR
ncbi:HalOD1 output domain-containing protein [Natronococcus wangiae]|uniref:HalOD1 output domain-containing protein n=1 Tax=Natronococcus wangiae TaxID=3068275 RepID=UPI00273DFCB1|nr:HalOD1 output domain-containing protein [Natronococcus sp. AD5]